MRAWARFVSGVRNLAGREARERDLDRELQAHLALLVDEKMAAGLDPPAARRAALLEMQGIEQVKEAVRDARSGVRLEQGWTDVRLAARGLRRHPGFTAVAAATLALALGANAAVFSVIDAVLLRPLPYRDADRLVLLWGERSGEPRRQVSATDIADVRRASSSFVDVATFGDWTPIVTGLGDAERINGTQVGDGFFTVMDVPPLLGRVFTAQDQEPGRDRVIVLTYQMWRHRFKADPAVVGCTVRMSGLEYEIVGVMPEELPSLPPTLVAAPGEFYRPVAEPYDDRERSSRHLRAIGRLKPGVTLKAAQDELDALLTNLEGSFPASYAGFRLRAVPLAEDTVGPLRPTLWLLFAGVIVVLLIGCVNLATLLLARTHARQREIAMRVALGASGWRLASQLAAETLLVSLLGGALGLALARVVMAALTPLAVSAVPQLAFRPPTLDGHVLVVMGALALLTTLLVSAVPLVQVRRASLRARIEPIAGQGTHSGIVGRGLIAAQVALALVLLFSAGLLVTSMQRLYRLDTGFSSDNRLVMNVWLPWTTYREPSKNLPFFRELLERIRQQPGVRAAGLVSTLPLRSFDQRSLEVAGSPVVAGQVPSPDAYVISPGYLDAMGIPVLEGRGFLEQDGEEAPLVALVNRTAARRLFGDTSPVGRRVRFYDGQPDSTEPWREVVGVVADVPQYGIGLPPTLQVYVPQAQLPTPAMVLVVHTPIEPQAMAAAVRQQLRALDPNIAPFRITTMEDLVSGSVAGSRLAASLTAAFAVLALLLGAVGVYGVVSNWVSRASHEIGVRIALGATPRQVRGLVVARGLRIIGAGLIVGVALALGAARALTAYLFEVHPADPAILLGAMLALMAAAVVAVYLPARRATRVDPLVALRAE